MKPLFIIIPAALTALSLAQAQEPTTGREHGHRSPEKMMGKLDTNHDGKISLEEWKTSPRRQKDPARAAEKFNKLDTNHDGFISLDELKALPFLSGREHGGRHHQGPSASPSPSVSP
jgi:Ca2+-binding EF-hand superfamily protein